MFGGTQNDTFIVISGDSLGIVAGSGNSGTISGYDVIQDFTSNQDVLDLQGTPFAAADIAAGNPAGNGNDSTLTIGGQTVKSHAISNGMITFDDANTYSAALTLTSTANVAAVVQYLQNNDLGNAGVTVAFTATIGGIAHTYIYEQVGATPNAANDIFIDLSNLTVTNLSTLISGGNLLPAGVSGSPINLGLTDPSPDRVGAVTVTVGGVPSDWTVSDGTNNGDGTWTVQTNDPRSLTITTPLGFAGACLLSVTETWTNPDGSTGVATFTDNIEAYAAGASIFAWSGDDTLTGSAGHDKFVFAQPIGHDTIYNFDVAADQINLIGFTDFTSFADIQAHTTNDANGNAVIILGDGESITVMGINAGSLTVGNFLFDQIPVTNNAETMTLSDGALLPLGGIVNNTGTIALNAAGNQTDLEILASGVTLQGGGHVTLSDSSANVIVGSTAESILTNVDNIISGAGQLGAGQLTLINELAGVIDADAMENALVIDTGSNSVRNYGTIEATDGGSLEIKSDVSNFGSLDGGWRQHDANQWRC